MLILETEQIVILLFKKKINKEIAQIYLVCIAVVIFSHLDQIKPNKKSDARSLLFFSFYKFYLSFSSYICVL